MSEEIILTEKQQAEALHKQITAYGEVICQSLYGMCTAIRQMRDSKLYKALGHSTFESYAQDMLGMTARQAYNYIAIASKLSEDFVNSSSQIGMKKLYLLAMAPEEVRAEIVQNSDLTETTVRELRARVSALTQECDREKQARLAAEAEAEQARGAAKEAEEAKERNRMTLRNLLEQKAEQVRGLEAQVKELENRPQNVAVVDHRGEIEALNAEISRLKNELAERPDTQLALGIEPIYQTDSRALFKPYLTAAADAVNRLAEFIGQHRNDANYGFFVEKMQAAFDFAKQKIEMIGAE